MNELKTTPHNDQAEMELLQTVLYHSNSFWEIQTALGGAKDAPMAFWRDSHRTLWRCFARLMSRGQDPGGEHIHLSAIIDDLGEDMTRSMNLPGMLERMSRECLGSPASAVDTARIVRKYAELRDLLSLSASISAKAYDPQADPAKITQDLLTKLTSAVTHTQAHALMDARQIDAQWEEETRAMVKGETGNFIPTGITALDDMIGGGICPGRYYIVGGITKHGKTTLATRIATELGIRRHVAVDWVSVEMGHVEVEDRILSAISNVDVTELKRNIRRDRSVDRHLRAWGLLCEARDAFTMSKIRVLQSGAPDVADIEAMAYARRAELGPDVPYLIVVDYIQNLTTSRTKDDVAALNDISRRLNALTKSKNINAALIGVIQFDKEAEKNWTQRRVAPRFSQVKGTSQIGNDANHLLILHRNFADQDDDEARSYVQVIQDLSRHGGMGRSFDGKVDLPTSNFRAWVGEPPTDNSNRNSNQGSKRRF